jgi:hypothetical protein
MNLAEKIALDCGVKVGTPYIDRLFMPIKEDDFIIIDTRCKYSFGVYDYFADVLELIKDYLKQNNIKIFQFANENAPRLACDKCFITINKKQEAYLISKAKLIISNENYSLYIAAILNTKSIGLYSINNFKNTRPVWNIDSQTILESDRDNNLPSYGQLSENPKTVNFISPYLIAKNILDQLNINNNFEKFELVHIGKSFNEKIIEVIPDFITNDLFLQNTAINLRLDYVDNLNLETLNFWFKNRKVNLITNKDLNIQTLIPHRNNIVNITIILSDLISEAFLKQLKQIGVRTKIFCREADKINHYRNKFFDWEIEKEFNDDIKLKDLKNISEKSFFISSKIIISKGKQYSCKANYLQNKNLDKTQENVIFSSEFETELEFIKIYNEREESISSASRT